MQHIQMVFDIIHLFFGKHVPPVPCCCVANLFFRIRYTEFPGVSYFIGLFACCLSSFDSIHKLGNTGNSGSADVEGSHTVGAFSDSHDFPRFYHGQFQWHAIILMEVLCDLCQD